MDAGRLEAIFDIEVNEGYRLVNGSIERGYHNGAHSRIGGWLGTGSSPRDPLFYLLHANVDRAWAQWQERFGRFDPKSEASYSAQGSYPGSTEADRLRKGSYAEDEMWPWGANGGDQGTSDPFDDWPPFSYGFPSPEGESPPTPGEMVDYLDVSGIGGAHSACYDDMGFVPSGEAGG